MESIRENNLVVNSIQNTNDYCQAMFATYPDLVDIKQLTKMLGIGVTLAYRLVQNNTIKALKVGRAYKIPKKNVIAYITNTN